MALTKVHAITVRQGRISVDVDRYTFVFVHDVSPNGRIELGEISSQVHGKRDTRINRGDVVAQHARREARELVGLVVKQWLREHPTGRLEDVAEAVLWLHPGEVHLTNQERAANLAMLDQLVSGLADKLKMPDDRRPLS